MRCLVGSEVGYGGKNNAAVVLCPWKQNVRKAR